MMQQFLSALGYQFKNPALLRRALEIAAGTNGACGPTVSPLIRARAVSYTHLTLATIYSV